VRDGLLDIDILAGLHGPDAVRVCQWFVVAIVTASMFLSSKIRRMSLSSFGLFPVCLA
jgi:hypothetical protein